MRHIRSAIVMTVFVCIMVLASAGTLQAAQSINANKALKLLKEGNARFVKMKLQHPNQTKLVREKTAAKGQKPFAVILACSDSRVPVEIIFDRGIGDIFVTAVAGNVAMDSSVIGSIEYAAQVLETPLLVVLGHTECGAVQAGISGAPTTGAIRDIQEKIEPVAAGVKTAQPGLKEPALTNVVVKANAIQAKDDILNQSEGIRKLVSGGKLKIMVAVYDIKTGKIEWVKSRT